MNIRRIISIGTLASFIFTIITFTTIYFQDNINSTLVQFGLFLVYTSSLFFANFALYEFNSTTSLQVKKSISLANFILSGIAALVFFDLIPFANAWHIIVGLGILFLLTVQLQLLGWSRDKHHIFDKILFSIVLISNVFLATLFIFKIDYYQLEFIAYIAAAVAIIALFYGLYFKGIRTIDPEKQKV